ncbi:MAG: hypothetical protein K9N00_02790 [Candidatus Marinimicrobia bacterium]|nr:hypothetical protein [Candidatus Neomarinimicrobiota bacterium]
MDGLEEWMDWKNGWIGRMDVWKNGCLEEWMFGWLDGKNLFWDNCITGLQKMLRSMLL